MRLRPKDLSNHREELLKKQNNTCPLCGTVILPEEAALDHDHDTGKVRQVLHRSCNQAEGRIKSWVNRSRHDGDTVTFLRNMVKYLETDYSENPEHPHHLTKIVKRFSAKNKADQVMLLETLGVEIPEKATKKDLAKLYRKSIG